MNEVSILVLAVVIGSNNLAVSFALGALGKEKYHIRILIVFGAFEFFIPLIGLAIGNYFAKMIDAYASIVGAALLVLLGILAIINSYKNKANRKKLGNRVTTWKGLIFLALGLSLDNLVIGFSLGLRDANPLFVASVIGIASVIFSFIGLKVGKVLTAKWEYTTEKIAGLLLILLGFAAYFEFI